MPISLYMDHHVPEATTAGLRLRRIDVLTAGEDGAAELDDSALLDRASDRGRVLFIQDRDWLREATSRQIDGHAFCGLIYAHQLRVPVGDCLRDLELIAMIAEPDDLRNNVVYLPI
jgi:hypothetical protein